MPLAAACAPATLSWAARAPDLLFETDLDHHADIQADPARIKQRYVAFDETHAFQAANPCTARGR